MFDWRTLSENIDTYIRPALDWRQTCVGIRVYAKYALSQCKHFYVLNKSFKQTKERQSTINIKFLAYI